MMLLLFLAVAHGPFQVPLALPAQCRAGQAGTEVVSRHTARSARPPARLSRVSVRLSLRILRCNSA